jgi:hypothetical protein
MVNPSLLWEEFGPLLIVGLMLAFTVLGVAALLQDVHRLENTIVVRNSSRRRWSSTAGHGQTQLRVRAVARVHEISGCDSHSCAKPKSM